MNEQVLSRMGIYESMMKMIENSNAPISEIAKRLQDKGLEETDRVGIHFCALLQGKKELANKIKQAIQLNDRTAGINDGICLN